MQNFINYTKKNFIHLYIYQNKYKHNMRQATVLKDEVLKFQ